MGGVGGRGGGGYNTILIETFSNFIKVWKLFLMIF